MTTPFVYHLPARATSNNTQALYDALLDLDPETPVEINARDVQRLGTLNVQILIGARRRFEGENSFKIINPSRDFDAGLALVGIDASFFTREVRP